jgi:serine protease
MPAGASTLSVWYRVFCFDTITYDWAAATLTDNVTGATITVLPNTCTNTNTWVQASASVTSMRGHSVTLTLKNHDDNYAGDATYTDFDDVNVQ